MKRLFSALNALMIAVLLCMTGVYMEVGGLVMKAATAECFALLGAVNLAYAALSRVKLRFPLLMCLGLLLAMTGDIALRFDFVLGAAFFAMGHLFYIAAMSALRRFSRQDVLLSAALFLISAGIVLLLPCFDFGRMLGVVLVYALVISCMVGKAVSNVIQERTFLYAWLAVGSFLFYFSDLMLVLYAFGDAPRMVDDLCLITYFPGQGMLASAIYYDVKRRLPE